MTDVPTAAASPSPQDDGGARLKAQALNRLWMRMSERGDFPILSESVRSAIAAMSHEDCDFAALVQLVLADFALTQKVLRLANSAMYRAFGGNITTISHALMVLGVDAVVHLTIGLKIVEHFHHSDARRIDAELELNRSILASGVARKLAARGNALAAEEAVVCTLMRQIGKLVVVFYLDAEWDRIRERIEAGVDETAASREVLGATLEDIGLEAASRWRLPDRIRFGMGPFDPGVDQSSTGHWLRAIASYSTEAAGVLTQAYPADGQREAQIEALAGRYADALGIEPHDVVAGSLEFANETAGATTMHEIDVLRGDAEAIRLDPQARIGAGAAELAALPATTPPGQALALACEILHEGLGLARTIAFVRHADGSFNAHIGFGPHVDALLPTLSFDAAFQPDVFHLAIANPVGIFVEHARAPKMIARQPAWFRRAFDDVRSFVLLPVVDRDQHTCALLYGDWSIRQKGRRIEQSEMRSLNGLARELGRFFAAGGNLGKPAGSR
ncbi:HDOD domain-containing protein [Paraburkholderia caballeronis]|uniref:HDOD domain-containing protein n=2 Tax=Paraburkholderia caballeronis TaxID=416943 RepID=A0A1H7FWW9_9BURK|nr:HDOD domain-containing protein [Paraburkholderia caballeronis]PXX00584.1 HDOD domain-containing protein [Paraburkholderia caballeronis]RAJ98647.1 HDOD domain-containing protein [Paraburkholderia caballeronis]SEE69023.1 HDOD domain-containing protein [Paraburkholderia caballeronis]SEK28982.1 HDOD domain-containing protein [Paraburkholderia caballeronis]